MPFLHPLSELDGMAAVRAVNETLRRIDARLVDHGERVAFIACELMEYGGLELEESTLLLLGVFHDIGAYKTDEIDRMVEFETKNVWNHSMYGYLFLKYLTPLHEMAEAILYHHTPWSELEKIDCPYQDYAALLQLADRLDIALGDAHTHRRIRSICENSGGWFAPQYAALVEGCLTQRNVLERLADGSYRETNAERVQRAGVSPEEALEYLKMVVYSIDFRSEHTVAHTINTVSIALNIACKFGLDTAAEEKIYLGALLHDVGKIAIPIEILEFPGKLTAEQMVVMRTHVDETEHLITGVIPDEICKIAVRHHEKLDGSGYPRGLTGDVLTLPERIVAVADIVSALGSRRSYKEPFPKERVLAILNQMKAAQLDPDICDYVCEEYEEIMGATDVKRDEIIQKYRSIMAEFQELKQRFLEGRD